MHEINMIKIYEYGKVNLVNGKEKGLLNKSFEQFYIDFDGLAYLLGLEKDTLHNYLSYDANLRESLMYYRDGYTYRIVKVINLEQFPLLLRMLKYYGVDMSNINRTKAQINWMLKEIPLEEGGMKKNGR